MTVPPPPRSRTRQVTLAGILSGMALALGATGLGYLPFPTVGGALTLMPLPAIVGGVVGGPWVGLTVGLVFGAFSLQRFPPPDPLVQLPPRALIGVVAWLLAAALLPLAPKRPNRALWAAAAGASLFHTGAVLALAVARGWFPAAAAGWVALTHGPLEALLAALLCPPLIAALPPSWRALPARPPGSPPPPLGRPDPPARAPQGGLASTPDRNPPPPVEGADPRGP